MQGISILIVDDDRLLVEKLEKTMKWERLGITAVLTANNIRQARSLLLEYPVQLMLCDIDMPQGSGLELLEWVRDQEIKVECVFLSSYANFAYAQKALRLSSREYLLKPISNADLEIALSHIIEGMQKEQKQPAAQESTPREKLWEDLLLRRVPEELCIRNAVRDGICKDTEQFVLVLVRILEHPKKGREKTDIAIFDFVIHNVISEYFEQKTPEKPEALVHISDLEWMLLLRADSSLSGAAGTRDGSSPEEELIQLLRKVLKCRIGVYISEVSSFKNLGSSRARLEYMESHAVLDEDYLLYEKSWSEARECRVPAPWEVWQKEMLQPDGSRSVQERVLDYLQEQRSRSGWSPESLDFFLHRFIRMLYQYLNDVKYDSSQIFDRQEYAGYEKAAAASMAGTKEFICYIFEKLEAAGRASESKKDVVSQLKEYIEAHLDEELSRAELAQLVCFSEGYVSKLFLKETGTTLPNYIAECRIQKAKEYLENSALPVSRIAAEVGYNSFSYFSKTFRELTGCTPNEYRMKINKKEHS